MSSSRRTGRASELKRENVARIFSIINYRQRDTINSKTYLSEESWFEFSFLDNLVKKELKIKLMTKNYMYMHLKKCIRLLLVELCISYYRSNNYNIYLLYTTLCHGHVASTRLTDFPRLFHGDDITSLS